MRVLRYTCIICLVITALGGLIITLLPAFNLEERLYQCFLGLLTGLISGAFLATVTSCCELAIKIRKQRKLLYEFVIGLSVCLRQMSVSFIASREQRLTPRLFASNLNCMKGPGLQFANLICTEIDEDLYALKEKSSTLNALRGMPTALGPQIYRLNCQCEILSNMAQIHDLNRQPLSSKTSDNTSKEELENEANKLVDSVVLLSNETVSKIEDQICVLFGKKKLKMFCKRLEEEVARVIPQINDIIKDSTMNYRA